MKKCILIFAVLAAFVSNCTVDDQEKAKDAAKDEIFYGNWCGPENSGPDDPVDDLDTCCQAHDICYDAAVDSYLNYLECTSNSAKVDCDSDFVQCMQNLPADSGTWNVSPENADDAESYKDKALEIFKTCTDLADLFD